MNSLSSSFLQFGTQYPDTGKVQKFALNKSNLKEPPQKDVCRQTVQSIIKGEGGDSDGQYTSSQPRSPLLTFCRAGFKARKRPSSVSLNFPLRFLSPYPEAVCASSTQGRCFPQHGISRFEAQASGAQSIHLNCTRKLQPRSQNFPTLLTSRAGTFNT